MKRLISVMLVAVMIVMCAASAFASTTKVTTGSVNMRKGAALSYKTIRTIPAGKTLTCTDSKKDSRGVTWYYTKYSGSSGWVSSVYLRNPGSAKKVYATGGDTYIRSSYKKTASIRGTLYKGTSATYLGSTKKDSRGVKWYKVSRNGTSGWVSSRYTVLK